MVLGVLVRCRLFRRSLSPLSANILCCSGISQVARSWCSTVSSHGPRIQHALLWGMVYPLISCTARLHLKTVLFCLCACACACACAFVQAESLLLMMINMFIKFSFAPNVPPLDNGEPPSGQFYNGEVCPS